MASAGRPLCCWRLNRNPGVSWLPVEYVTHNTTRVNTLESQSAGRGCVCVGTDADHVITDAIYLGEPPECLEELSGADGVSAGAGVHLHVDLLYGLDRLD